MVCVFLRGGGIHFIYICRVPPLQTAVSRFPKWKFLKQRFLTVWCGCYSSLRCCPCIDSRFLLWMIDSMIVDSVIEKISLCFGNKPEGQARGPKETPCQTESRETHQKSEDQRETRRLAEGQKTTRAAKTPKDQRDRALQKSSGTAEEHRRTGTSK